MTTVVSATTGVWTVFGPRGSRRGRVLDDLWRFGELQLLADEPPRTSH